ncbi:hypothetical protein [Paraburkholderia sp. EG304]|uniref:hypothetical protein n=1 Tax=Paraburkholderia sp. EG304 TaxID=3237015 RepID=UPI00397BAAEE
MKQGKVFAALAVVAAGLVFILSVASTFETADWDSRPDADQLRRAGEELELPAGSIGGPLKSFSKVTLVGARRNVVTHLQMDEVKQHFSRVAKKNGWTLTSRQSGGGETSLSYCAGDFAHIVAFHRRGDETAIFAATYWDSDRSTELYCRKSTRG